MVRHETLQRNVTAPNGKDQCLITYLCMYIYLQLYWWMERARLSQSIKRFKKVLRHSIKKRFSTPDLGIWRLHLFLFLWYSRRINSRGNATEEMVRNRQIPEDASRVVFVNKVLFLKFLSCWGTYLKRVRILLLYTKFL